jgi:hypothetical protein
LAYVGSVRADSSGNLLRVRIRGNTAFYDAQQVVLTGGTATVETAVDLAPYIPPNASSWIGLGIAQASDPAANVNAVIALRIASGTTLATVTARTQAANITETNLFTLEAPNVGQNIYYLWSTATATTRAFTLTLMSYRLPNGGS